MFIYVKKNERAFCFAGVLIKFESLQIRMRIFNKKNIYLYFSEIHVFGIGNMKL